jgi:hypothetical protein
MHRFWRILRILFFVSLAVAAFGFLVMWLWNWLMPPIFGLHAINYWKALGLLVLSRILFGGFARQLGPGRDWRMRLMRRWEDMSPEERAKFRAGMRGGCSSSGPAPAAPQA